MTAGHDMAHPLRAQLQELLAAQGWTVLHSVALACRVFPTAVGPKRADVYIHDYGPETAHVELGGEYWSEGRNVLEARGVLVPRTGAVADLESLVARFCAEAIRAVEQSYAARLLSSPG